MISFPSVSGLHIIPKGQMVSGAYYRDCVLADTCMAAIKSKAKTGTILEKSMLPNMFYFMHDGAPAHTAKLAQQWCAENLPNFWRKEDWPGNFPDLNPIENVGDI